jgi:hypothetical protein
VHHAIENTISDELEGTGEGFGNSGSAGGGGSGGGGGGDRGSHGKDHGFIATQQRQQVL